MTSTKPKYPSRSNGGSVNQWGNGKSDRLSVEMVALVNVSDGFLFAGFLTFREKSKGSSTETSFWAALLSCL